jgi:hypothetical protein
MVFSEGVDWSPIMSIRQGGKQRDTIRIKIAGKEYHHVECEL